MWNQFYKSILIIASLTLGVATGTKAQYERTLDFSLLWKPVVLGENTPGGSSQVGWTFEGGMLGTGSFPALASYHAHWELTGPAVFEVQWLTEEWETVPGTIVTESALPSTSEVKVAVYQEGNKYKAGLHFLPFRARGNQQERLKKGSLKITWRPLPVRNNGGRSGPLESALANGTIYKIGVQDQGIFKMDFNFLKNVLKVDYIESIDPRNIRLLSGGGGPVPESNAVARVEDLVEIPIWINGESDGKFNSNDALYFYAQGPHLWIFDSNSKTWSRRTNIYDDRNYYFLKIDNQPGLRISEGGNGPGGSVVNTFDDYARYEKDEFNALNEYISGQGSGQKWYADKYLGQGQKNYEFNFPGLLTTDTARMRTVFGGRSDRTSTLRVTVNNNTWEASVSGTNLGDPESTYAREMNITGFFIPGSEKVVVNLLYPTTRQDQSEGYLDFIDVQVRRNLALYGEQTAFRSLRAIGQAGITYEVEGGANHVIWDITNPLLPVQPLKLNNDSKASINAPGGLREYVVFDASKKLNTPDAFGIVPNQNLHGMDVPEMVIVYDDFKEAAERLAAHRRSNDGLSVTLVSLGQIMNEFGAGKREPAAIRDFARMLYNKNNQFHYLLLFGDGSFDARDRYKRGSNVIPVWETPESLQPIFAFPSDDFYALLSDDEGPALRGLLEIAVGRIPVKNATEANAIVDKIIRYDTDKSTLADWRNKITFVADDGDANIHAADSDLVAIFSRNTYPEFNQNKLYCDAFPKDRSSGSPRFPDVQTNLTRDVERGVLVVNYLGHGGPNGWGDERYLTLGDITGWRNEPRYPLFVTATCTFTSFDNPKIESAGEKTFLNPQGGAIGLMSTSRAVYASQNKILVDAVFLQLLARDNLGIPLTMGEIMRQAKNQNPNDDANNRKFALIGDPSQRLAVPRFKVVTNTINGKTVADFKNDTIKALQLVKIEGEVQDQQGNLLSDFNGKVYPTFFDKPITVRSLGNDNPNVFITFDQQKNILFRGQATVSKGKFSFEFVVPIDIDYRPGFGRLSYYAENGVTDANGYTDNIRLGGVLGGVVDNAPPQVKVFMNSVEFAKGGLTNESPTLLVQAEDDNGINTAGTSVGHNLEAVLNDDQGNPIVMNEYFITDANNFRKGEARYPLSRLREGKHTVKVQVWDVSNNSSTGETEFVVANSGKGALDHVLNIPNPFTTRTKFQFEHNLAAGTLSVEVRILTISGVLVKTLAARVDGSASRIASLEWDGRDEYGDSLARGVYVYQVRVKPEDGTDVVESEYQKLVIIK